MKHTPGPWHLGKGSGEGNVFVDQETRMRMTDQGTTLYSICKVTDGWNQEEDEANARLIASAPELLEACQFALITIKEDWEDKSYAIAQLRTVIRKAMTEGMEKQPGYGMFEILTDKIRGCRRAAEGQPLLFWTLPERDVPDGYEQTMPSDPSATHAICGCSRHELVLKKTDSHPCTWMFLREFKGDGQLDKE